jgi:hypothetical protein
VEYLIDDGDELADIYGGHLGHPWRQRRKAVCLSINIRRKEAAESRHAPDSGVVTIDKPGALSQLHTTINDLAGGPDDRSARVERAICPPAEEQRQPG